jgi:CheY-like chemotaxis protein
MTEANSVRKTILVAEDDTAMRRFVEVTLERLGYSCITAEDGLEGLKIALSDPIDAVVADAMMPNMSGYDLCRMLAQNEKTRHLPFIILSGLESEASDSGGLGNAHITKGVHLKEDLESALAILLG